MRNLLLFFVISVISQITFAITENNLDKAFQDIVDQFRSTNHIASATLTINSPIEKLPKTFVSGTISRESPEPITGDNLFQVGSITKSFIATIILKLQSQGLLSLDDSISRYLPEYTQWNEVTIRQLLNHTSGIYNYTDSLKFRSEIFTHPYDYLTPETLINFAANESPYFKPGQGWHYSNTNYILLGRIIERITGYTPDRVLDDYLLKNPELNLHSTYFVNHLYNKAINAKMMHGYYQLSADNEIDITGYSLSWLNSAGGIVSNGSDLSRWLRSLFTGKILNRAEFDEFSKLVSTDDGQPISVINEQTPSGYGLGIQALKTNLKNIDVIWWHSGGTIGYKTLMMWLPKQQLAIVASYTQVVAGNEAIPFDPTTPFAQSILLTLSKVKNQTETAIK